jgi:hypothetical protein
MSSYAEHIANLSHAGGLPRSAHQAESSAALLAAVEALRKTRLELATEIETARKQFGAERKTHAAELAAERAVHDATLAAERAAHNERVQKLDEILRSALEGRDKRAPALLARHMAIIDEALR